MIRLCRVRSLQRRLAAYYFLFYLITYILLLEVSFMAPFSTNAFIAFKLGIENMQIF